MEKEFKKKVIGLFKFFIKVEIIFIIVKGFIIFYLFTSDLPTEIVAFISLGLGGAFWMFIKTYKMIKIRHDINSLPSPIRN